MGLDKGLDFEGMIFPLIEKFKILFFPDQWSEAFLDYSKNELLALLFLYRYKAANMTELSEFINAPLNTTTGVAGRLEKKGMVERIRSTEDRRVVQITLTDKAKELINKEKELIEYYFKEIYKTLTEDEKTAAVSIFRKITEVLYNHRNKLKTDVTAVKKVKKITIE